MNDAVEYRPIDRGQHVILVVDDDRVTRYTTVRWLQHAGFRTREAATGAEGIELADDGVSAVVLDVHLPDINGFEVCRLLRLRPAARHLPVLYLSAAYVTDEDKVRGLDSGADSYLTHPVDPAVLVASVQALVRTRIAEAALRRSEQRYRAVYERATVGIGLLDGSGRIIEANPSLLEIMGRPLEDVAARPLREFVPAACAETARSALAPAAASITEMVFPVRRPDDSERQLRWTVVRDVEPGLNMVMATDITATVLLEEQRQLTLQSERAARTEAQRIGRIKDELIAVLSHELRTPLTAMLGWIHIFHHKPIDESRLERGLEVIERNLRLQARLVSDLLDMSSINLGKMRLGLEWVDVPQVVRSVVEASEAALVDKGLTIQWHLDSDCPRLRADPARVQQIVSNLLDNAIKFSNRSGEITVSARQSESGVQLSVSDRGIGIAPEFQASLFDRFSQADVGSNRRHGGLGLGLSIVRHLAESHGGHVSVDSAGPGQGATFRVWLPLAGPLQESGRIGEPGGQGMPDPEATLSGVSLLVVDDDPDVGAVLSLMLRDRGADVRLAGGVDEALVEIARRRPDILLSDIGMPGKDGYALLAEVRRSELGRRLPAVAITSYARGQDKAQVLAQGFDAHCAKPIQPMELLRTLEGLLRRAT